MKSFEKRRAKTGLLIATLLVVSATLGACGESIDSRMEKASTELASGDYRSAEIQLKNVLQRESDNVRARFLLGQLSLATAQYDDAVVQFQRARNLGFAEEKLHQPLARALLGAQRYKDVLSTLPEKPSGEAAVRAAKLSLRGDAMVGLQRYDAAGEEYATALSLVPEFPHARVGQADIAKRQGDKDKATEILAGVLAQHPDYSPALKAQGALAYNDGRYDDAITLFKHILALESTEVPQIERFMARAFLADCQLRLQRYDGAEKNIATLMKQGPQNPYANYLQAMVSVRHKDYEQATIHLQRVLKVSPRNTRALILMASVKSEQGDDELAKSYLNEVLASAPKNYTALRMLAALLIRQGHPEDAVERLQGVLALSPNDMRLRAMLAEALVSAGDSRAALKYALSDTDKQLKAGTSWPIGLATRMVQAGDDEAAKALLDQIGLSAAGDDIKTGVLRIVLLLRKGDTEQALARAKALVDEQPDDATRLRLLASTYLASGRVNDARATLKRGLTEANAGTEFRLALGLLSLRQGNYDSAGTELKAILDTEPDNLGAQVALAKLSSAQGDSDGAIEWLKKAQKAHPDNDGVDVTLTQTYLEAGMADKAVAMIEPLVERHPKDGVLSHLHGIALVATKRLDAGIEALARAVQLVPDQPGYQLDLAQAQLAAGKTDVAREQLATLRQQFPQFVPAAAAMANIQLKQGNGQAALATAEDLAKNTDTGAAGDTLKGDILAAQGRFATAAKAYEDAFSSQPVRELALKVFEARRQAGQPDAGAPLEHWLDDHPKDVSAKLLLAGWEQASGRTEGAISTYHDVLAMDADNVAALNNLALIYANKDDARALELAQRAYALDADNPAVVDTLGWLTLQAGKQDRAVSLIREAAESAPSVPEIQYHLAAALAKSSTAADRAEARKILDRLLNTERQFEDRPKAEQLSERIDSKDGESSG